MKKFLLLAAMASASLLTQNMSASIMGNLNFANCNNGGVTVTSTTITWSPVGTGGASTGCISAGLGTNLVWSLGGSMTSGAVGYIQDEPGAPPLPFLVFPALAGNPTQTLNFLLTNNFVFAPPAGFQGAGSAACAAASATPGDSCITSATSPFLLIANSDGSTTVNLSAAGTAADPNNGSPSNWKGVFTTQLQTNPTGVYNSICPTVACGGSISTTYSFSGSVSFVPEPGAMTMMFIGAGLLAFTARRRKVKV